ncbi:MAG: hypothetical protein KGD68_12155 [Candidatus Lokiarchaeota archaeon]|nr:hypothetical protein [Candidatus Lokiarchaeota archaeon]
MLDIILIQHVDTGLNLLEYRQEHTIMKTEHSDIFTGFMKAIQNIAEELNIGYVVLISTEGTKGHNCIIIPKYPINVIILVDQDDPIELWKQQGKKIAEKFLSSFGNSFNPNIAHQFKAFSLVIKEMCSTHEYCD